MSFWVSCVTAYLGKVGRRRELPSLSLSALASYTTVFNQRSGKERTRCGEWCGEWNKIPNRGYRLLLCNSRCCSPNRLALGGVAVSLKRARDRVAGCASTARRKGAEILYLEVFYLDVGFGCCRFGRPLDPRTQNPEPRTLRKHRQ